MRFFVLLLLSGQIGATTCRIVDNENIVAADLAAGIPAFGRLAPQTFITQAPLPGAHRTFLPRELTAIAKAKGISLDGNVAEICFDRAVQPLNAGQIAGAMRSVLTGRNITVELVDYLHAPLPSGTLDFQPSGIMPAPGAAFDAPVFWRGTLRFSPQHTIPIWAVARVYEEFIVVIASSEIPAGARIADGNVKLIRRYLSPFAQHFDSLDAVIGRVAKKTIPQGTPLCDQLLETPPDVNAGDSLLVVATNGQARIKFHAIARSQGRKGDRIVLLNPDSNRTFRAVLDGNGQAHVGGGA